jgi:general secretion pathway protein F
MTKFAYKAKDAEGRERAGAVEADSAASARQKLAAEGLQVTELTLAGDEEVRPPSKLSNEETEDVVMALAELSSAELPLAEGLRAAAAESTNARVSRALLSIAVDVERGYALESVMSERGEYLPAHVRGLIAAAARSRQLGLALDELVEHHRASREIWGRIVGAIAYPLLVLGFSFFVFAFLPIFVIPQFAQMFREFDLDLPVMTELVLRLSDAMVWATEGFGKWVVLTMLIALVTLIIFASLGVGTSWSQRLAASMPLVGPIWQWSGAAGFSRLLATMIEHGIPLPEAVRLAGDGVRDPEIQATSLMLADGIENGRSLSDLLVETNRLPMTLVPFVRWGEKTGKLSDGLRTASELFLLRLSMRAVLLRSIAPPVVFIFVGMMVGFFVISLFMPMVDLIQGLS